MQPADVLVGEVSVAEQPVSASSVPGAKYDLSGLTRYELRYTLQHLRDAQLHDEVHRVLSLSGVKGQNAWYESLVAAGLRCPHLLQQ